MENHSLIGRREALRLGGAFGLVGLGLQLGATGAAAAEKWVDLAPMPIGQCEGNAAVLDGKIYVMGGWKDILNPFPLVQIYDPATNKWSEGTPLPTPLHHFGTAVVGGQIYVVGGFPNLNDTTKRVATNKVWAFDPQTGKWTERAPMPEPNGCIAGTVHAIGNTIYAAGGEVARRPGSVTPDKGDIRHQSVTNLSAYDTVSNTWKELAPMRVARDHGHGGVINGKLYIAGGRERPKLNLDVCEVFDPATGKWADCAPMPTGRSGGSSAVFGGKLFTFGGEGNAANKVGLYEEVEAYDPSSNSWTKYNNMAHPRQATQAATLGSRIYLFGGVPQQGGENVITQVDAFEVV